MPIGLSIPEYKDLWLRLHSFIAIDQVVKKTSRALHIRNWDPEFCRAHATFFIHCSHKHTKKEGITNLYLCDIFSQCYQDQSAIPGSFTALEIKSVLLIVSDELLAHHRHWPHTAKYDTI
ncbi:unnamed protein product [Meganyctiphanes norvegica]|uniref:Uncharacterized protein n=1 Tax=Meganyctiphanes norvegica TaxID=48144 RepID=A0AAV2SWG9_MEGNR